MYVVVAQATAQPDRREEMVQLLTEMAAASRTEDGCISYKFASDIEAPDTFNSIELWTDKDALLAHLAGPGLAAALEKLGPMLAAAPTITGYEAPAEPDQLA